MFLPRMRTFHRNCVWHILWISFFCNVDLTQIDPIGNVCITHALYISYIDWIRRNVELHFSCWSHKIRLQWPKWGRMLEGPVHDICAASIVTQGVRWYKHVVAPSFDVFAAWLTWWTGTAVEGWMGFSKHLFWTVRKLWHVQWQHITYMVTICHDQEQKNILKLNKLQGTSEGIYQGSFQHSRTIRFSTFIQYCHMGPPLPFKHVAIFGVWPSPHWIVCVANLKDHGVVLSEKTRQNMLCMM